MALETQAGKLCVDVSRYELRVNGKRVRLERQPMDLLILFVQRRGELVTREEIIGKLWGKDVFVDVDRSINSAVRKIRTALGDDPAQPHYLETVVGKGYRFIGDVDVIGTTPLSSTRPVWETPVAPALGPTKVRWRYLASALLLVGMVAALGVGLYFWLTTSRPALSFSKRDWVLVTDFENRTGDPRFEKALLTAFTVSLEQSRYANVFPRSRLGGTLKRMGRGQSPEQDIVIDEALGREICQRENLRGLVTAAITRTGQQYELIARLVDPQTGNPVRTYTERVRGEDGILDALDAIAGHVRRDLGETLYSIQRNRRALPQVTTPSLNALQEYAQASLLWDTAHYRESQEHLQEALKADPDFAMAHAAMGVHFFSHLYSDPVHGQEHFDRALRLNARVTERERMLIQSAYAASLGHSDDAIRLYQEYLLLYPDDLDANYALGTTLMGARRLDDAINLFHEVIRIDPLSSMAYINIATCYEIGGRFKEAMPYFSRAFEIDPNLKTGQNLNHQYGIALVATDQPDKAREVFALMLSMTPDMRSRGMRSLALLDLYQGKYRDAKPRLVEAIHLDESVKYWLLVARNHLYLAMLFQGQGDARGELRELDMATKTMKEAPAQTWIAARIGVAYARAGALEKAASLEEWVRAHTDAKSPSQAADSHWIEGEIELARGNPEQALVLLQQADQKITLPLYRESLARASERAGRKDEAIREYESLLKMTDALGWEPQQGWLEGHVALARLYAVRGDKQQAANILGQFLHVWEDADPDLPLLRTALRLQHDITP